MKDLDTKISAKRPHYPVGIVFELTLDGDAPENQPLVMVKRDCYGTDWKYQGEIVKGVQTRRFKCVSVGYQPSFDALRVALASYGKIPEGQWREALKRTFESDGVHPCGTCDSSWKSPNGHSHFPYVSYCGISGFGMTNTAFTPLTEGWLWLVEVVEVNG